MLEAWLDNIHEVLRFPISILTVLGLIVIGTFAETSSRSSLKWMDTYLGRALFFATPFAVAHLVNWSTGLLAAVVSLILFARLQKHEVDEGFVDTSFTELISTSNRWFVERVLGETPIGISSERIPYIDTKDEDSRTSSSSSMATTGTSDSNK